MSQRSKDEAAIKEILLNMAKAWNAGDGAGYAAAFLDDATYISFDGQLAEGRQVIQDVHQMLFDGPLKGSKMDDQHHGDPKIRFLTDDSVVVISVGGVSFGESAETDPDRGSIISITAVRHGDTWRLASFQNTRRQAAYQQ
ncbi:MULTISPECIES: SgcJ/EcaC family oxidoreductase [Streptomyces]|uniref:SgcJ/EcaC family oxidoreductase n=1 Tax=Streptomyces huasconensis TaxID=1854574 RepID=A0ABV3M7C9_9ACTN|nr:MULTISPECIES: SgcJ/EcaC family oxidoreductase [Streptomyces]UFQ18595.1 SgcJ/EcaC family oxidoreductase [Streptomyces huasconensis]WCL88210.1 SgcJ/EcaC family oxidoreductase [Streptomyces sp. JCM 35825]